MSNLTENVTRKPQYQQVCIWPATYLGGETAEDFEKWFEEEFKTRVQYLETVTTGPDLHPETREPVPGTGGRTDIFFAIHEDDIKHFALRRFQIGASWLEDVVADINGYNNNPIYPERVLKYKCWGDE